MAGKEKDSLYVKGTIEEGRFRVNENDPKEGPFQGRGEEEYIRLLNLEEGFFDGKNILDIGSGPQAELEHDLKERADVSSFSPDYSDEKYRGWLPVNTNAVAGIAQSLPYADESFDVAVSMWVVPHLKHSPIDLTAMIFQAHRVVKPGGEVHIFPVTSRLIPTEKPFDEDLAMNFDQHDDEQKKADAQVVENIQRIVPDARVESEPMTVSFSEDGSEMIVANRIKITKPK